MAELTDRLSAALSEALHASEDEMVLKWICMVETVDADGARGMWSLADDDCTVWDRVGMLAYGLQRHTVEMTADRLDDGS